MITPQANPWEKWNSQNITPEQSTKDLISEEAQEIKNEEYKPPTTEDFKEGFKQGWDKWKVEQPVSEWPRTVARYASRTLEQGLGKAGDLFQTAKGLISEYPAASGLLGYVAETLSPGSMKKAAEGFDKNTVMPLLGSANELPTSKELKEVSNKVTKGFTEPQTKSEEKNEEKFEDALNLLIQPPGTAAFKAARIRNPILRQVEPVTRALGTVMLAHGAAEGVKAVGGGESAQLATKMGSMLLTGFMIPRRTARQLSNDLYAARDRALQGVNTSHDATRFNQVLNHERQLLLRGTPGPHEHEVVGRIDQLLAHSQGGRIDVNDLIAAKRQINEAREGLFALPRGARKTARQRYNDLARHVDNEIEAYGAQNPEFLHFQRAADEVWGAMTASNVVGNMIERVAPMMHLKSPIASAFSHGAAATLGTGVTAIAKAGLSSAIPISAGAAAGSAVYQGGKIMYRIMRSPNLRHLYTQVVANSLEGNAVAMMNNLKKLDNAYMEDEKRNAHVPSPEQRRDRAIQKRTELSKPRKVLSKMPQEKKK